MIMSRIARLLLCLMLVMIITGYMFPSRVASQEERDYWPTEEWQTSTPEEQGMDPALLDEMVAFIYEADLPADAMIVVRHGYSQTGNVLLGHELGDGLSIFFDDGTGASGNNGCLIR